MKILQKILFSLFLSIFMFHSIVAHHHNLQTISSEENKSILEEVFQILKDTIQFDLGKHHLEDTSLSNNNNIPSDYSVTKLNLQAALIESYIIKKIFKSNLPSLILKKNFHSLSICYRGPTSFRS